MNREKWFAVVSVIVLMLCVMYAWRLMQVKEFSSELERAGVYPLRVPEIAFAGPDDPSFFLVGRDPFAWEVPPPAAPPPVLKAGKEVPSKKSLPPRMAKKEPQKESSTPSRPKESPPPQAPPPPLPPVKPVYVLPVELVGVVKLADGREVILKDKDLGKYVRLREGEKYKKITVVKILGNYVILKDPKGKEVRLP